MKEEKKGWKGEIARDLVALGSIPFFILVLVRVYLLNKPDYFSQFIIAGILLILLSFLIKINLYSGLALIILIFTNLYYQDIKFGIFAGVAYVLLLCSLVYLKKEKKEIVKGVFFGLVFSGITYYIVNLF
jgi:hypothetical protein